MASKFGQSITFTDVSQEQAFVDFFASPEGTIDQIYGRIGNGKTYKATADIIWKLKHGRVIYANWRVKWEGYDERESLWCVFLSCIGLKKAFFNFPADNFKYFPYDDSKAKEEGYESFIDKLSQITDADVYLDEGHLVFDSYLASKMSLQKRAAVLHTRHFNRTIVAISQRPTAIHVSVRANVNRFFRVERLMSWPFLIFRSTEFQDFSADTVDEELPVSTQVYFARRDVLEAYNSKYLRAGVPTSQKVEFAAYKPLYGERWRMLGILLYRLIPSIEIPRRFSARERDDIPLV